MAAANAANGQEPVASTSGTAGPSSSSTTRPALSRQASGASKATARHRAGSSQSHAHSHSQSNTSARSRGTLGTAGRPPHHRQALSAIRTFLRRESCFDILPESFRMIVLDNKLLIKRALVALQTNGVVSAPLYDSSNYRFAGMFTMVDVIHLIQYYYLSATGYDNAAVEVESVDLSALRDIEVAIDVPPPPIISVHPDDQLYTACAALVRTHARRLPLIDKDEQTGKETIVSVLTQYRVLKFIAINCRQECTRLTESIGTLGIGTYIASFNPNGEPMDPSDAAAGPSQQTPHGGHSRRQRSRSWLPTPRGSGGASGASTPLRSSLSRPEEGLPADLQAAGLTTPVVEGESTSTPRADDPTPEVVLSETLEPPAPPPNSTSPAPTTDRFHPLATATLQTTVFDVVHLFSDLGISAVPIVDNATGQVINLYEAVDVVDLIRSNAYQVLDLTIEDALNRRSKDFPGVVTCTPEDSLASIMAYIRERRAHRFIIVEGDDNDNVDSDAEDDASIRSNKVPGRLVGVLCLSDLLQYFVGSGSLAGMKMVGLGLGFRSEEEGLAIPRVVDDQELDDLNEGVSGLGIQS